MLGQMEGDTLSFSGCQLYPSLLLVGSCKPLLFCMTYVGHNYAILLFHVLGCKLWLLTVLEFTQTRPNPPKETPSASLSILADF